MGVHTRSGFQALHERRSKQPQGMTLRDTLVEELDAEMAAEQEARTPFLEWALRLPEPKGPLDFKRFPFQKELYTEGADDPEMVVRKSTQVGISAYLVRWTLYWADMRRSNALYVFPKSKHMTDFSDARIRPVIAASPYLRSRIPGHFTQNKHLKQIGGGFVYFRGSESKDDLDSVDADVLALDEYDTLTQENIPDAERRVGASAAGLIRRVGVPSVPGFGIDKMYEASDKRQWLVKCDACNEWQPLDFWKNVDQKRVLRICASCTKPLDVTKGEWVAEHPDRTTRGYHVPRLIVPRMNLQAIIDASKARKEYERQVFHNKDLGLGYASKDGRLSDAALQAAQDKGGGYVMQPGYVGADLVTMGVDVASTRDLNVRISKHLDDGRKIALHIGLVESFDELSTLMDRYSVSMCCIDHLPEGKLARSFAQRHAGRVYLVAYQTSPTPTTPDVIKVDEDARFITVRRVEAIDAMMELVRSQRNLLPLDWPEDYTDHMKALNRVVTKDEVDRVQVTYVSTGPDDYAQAEVYDLVATEAWLIRQEVDHSQESEFASLDDKMEFERSALDRVDQDDDSAFSEYDPGRDDDHYL